MVRALAAEGYLGAEARATLDAAPVDWLDPLPEEAAIIGGSVPGDVAQTSSRASDRSGAG